MVSTKIDHLHISGRKLRNLLNPFELGEETWQIKRLYGEKMILALERNGKKIELHLAKINPQ